MPYLFSYGTLQKEQVQIETFGRILQGDEDSLAGYELTMVEISDPEVLLKSGERFHPIVIFTGNAESVIRGSLFEISEQELLHADAYEVEDYNRIETVFQSGKAGFIYIRK